MVESGVHPAGGPASLAAVVQQKGVELTWAPLLAVQVSEPSIWLGVFEPAHEKPYESPAHPETPRSGAHVDPEKVSPVRQQ